MSNNKSFIDQVRKSIIRGFVSRIIIVGVLSVLILNVYKYAVNNGYIANNGFVTPLLIISCVIIGIIVLILYAVHVFKVLKTKFLNLEQQAAQQAIRMADGYSMYPNTQYGDMYQQTVLPQKKRQYLIVNFVTIVFTLVIILAEIVLCTIYAEYLNAKYNYISAEAVITAVNEHEIEVIDSDGHYHYETKYDTEYKYEIDGINQFNNFDSTKYYSVGQIIEIFVDPTDSYKTPTIKWEKDTERTMQIIIIGLLVFLIVIIGLSAIIKRALNKVI